MDLAVKLFGASGQQMIPLLNEGSAALREQAEEAKKFGQIVGPEFSNNAQKFNDAITKFKEAFGGTFLKFAEKILPVLVKVSEWAVNWLKESGAVEVAAKALAEVFYRFSTMILFSVRAFKALSVAVETFASHAKEGRVFEGLQQGAAALKREMEGVVEYITTALTLQKEGDKGGQKQPQKLDDVVVKGEPSQFSLQWSEFNRRMDEDILNLNARWIQLGSNMADVFTNGIGRAIDATTDSIMGLIDGTTTWQQAFSQAARAIIADTIRIVLQWVVSQAMIRALGKAAHTERITQLATETGAAALPALFGSISSYGAAAAVGIAALLAAVALAGGFAEGGPVRGPGTGTSDSIMARLSNGEYVLRAAAVQKYGMDTAEAMNAGTLQLGGGGGATGPVNVTPAAVNVAVINNKSELRAFLDSADGRQMIVDAVTARKMELGLES